MWIRRRDEYMIRVKRTAQIRIQQLNMKEVSSRTSDLIAFWQFLSLVKTELLWYQYECTELGNLYINIFLLCL